MTIGKNNWFSKSGKKLTDLHPLNYSTNRNCTISNKKLYNWLIENALNEAKNNSYLTTLVNAININNISKSDLDTLNLIIFDEIDVYLKFKKDGNKLLF